MAVTIPQEELAELKGTLPQYFYVHNPLKELAYPESSIYIDPDYLDGVTAYMLRQRRQRSRVTLAAIVVAVAIIVSLAHAMFSLSLAFLLLAPVAAFLVFDQLQDEYGDQYVRQPVEFAALLAVGATLALIPGAMVSAAVGDVPGPLVGVAASAAALWYLKQKHLSPPGPRMTFHYDGNHEPERLVLRGPKVHMASQVLPAALMQLIETTPRRGDTPLVHFKTHDLVGGMPVVRGSTSNTHKLFVGMAGSGKTICFRMLMGSLLPLPAAAKQSVTSNVVRRSSRYDTHQAIVYDAKSEHVPLLTGHGFQPRKDLFILNPFDRRAVAWDLARDIRSPADARLLADVFLQSSVPPGQNAEQHQYFRTNARRQITGVVQAFIYRGGKQPRWTLRDVINAFASQDSLKHVLSQYPEGKAVIEQTMNIAHETATGIYSSSTTYLDDFRIVASLWHRLAASEHAEDELTSISLEDWVQHQPRTVLLLPNVRENETVVRPLNRLLFKRLSQLLLDSRYNHHVETGEGTKERRAIFLDECSQLGRLEGLSDLLTEGREFGVEVVIGVQTYSQMVSAYGEQDAKTILGQCGFKAFLKCDGDTAQWAGKQIGQQLEKYSKMSYSTSTSGSDTVTTGHLSKSHGVTSGWQKSSSESYEERVQDAVLASEISGLPDPRAAGQFHGYYVMPHLPVFYAGMPLPLLDELLEPKGADPRRDPMDVENEWLPPWDKADYARLGLLPPPDDELSGPKTRRAPKSAAKKPASVEDLFD